MPVKRLVKNGSTREDVGFSVDEDDFVNAIQKQEPYNRAELRAKLFSYKIDLRDSAQLNTREFDFFTTLEFDAPLDHSSFIANLILRSSKVYPDNSLFTVYHSGIEDAITAKNFFNYLSFIPVGLTLADKSYAELLDFVNFELSNRVVVMKDFLTRCDFSFDSVTGIVIGDEEPPVHNNQVLIYLLANSIKIAYYRERAEVVGSFADSIRYLLANHATNLEHNYKVRDIDILSNVMRGRVLDEWNNTYQEFPQEKTIQQMFEEQVARTPDNIAVFYENTQLTYHELNQKSNQLAHYLRESYQVQGDDLIALCLDRSELMLIAILGVLKSGAAYVPLDPSYPDERIAYMLQDAKAKLILSNQIYNFKLSSLINKINTATDNAGIELIDSSQVIKLLKKYPVINPNISISSQNLAYVIYTSGTTGMPKGVMIEHRGVVNRIKWMNDTYPLREHDKILQKTPYVFDVSVWELFWGLWYGASIVFAKPSGHKDPHYLIKLMNEIGITVTHFVPSMLSVFLGTLESRRNQAKSCNPIPSLRYVFCSGEALNLDQVSQFHELLPQLELHNLYGPTEASIEVLAFDCTSKDLHAIYIGKPIANTQAYVVDSNCKLLPIGATGELYIGGLGLARGYLNQPELTSEKFIANPFQSKEDKSQNKNSKLYKTGDLVRYLPDGNIEYIGRNDFQVKLRGFRIELGEIEQALVNLAGVRQAVVVVVTKQGSHNNSELDSSKFLVGYYVADRYGNQEDMLAELAKVLPEYMLPNVLVFLERLPLTISGKLDRRALPEPNYSATDNYIAPESELEKQLCSVFADILDLPVAKIGVKDSFFRLGGNSLSVIKLTNRINASHSIKINVGQFYKSPNIQSIAACILSSNAVSSYQTIQCHNLEHYPLSFMQEQLLYIYHLGESGAAYNCPSVIKLSSFNFSVLKQALLMIINRHEVLRTVFYQHDDNLYQKVLPPSTKFIEEYSFDSEPAYLDFRDAFVVKTFDLYAEYAIRCALVTVGNELHLISVIHHIATDGWSTTIFYKELFYFYHYFATNSAAPVADEYALAIQYKDFAVWHRNYISQYVLNSEVKQFWQNYLHDYTIASFPADFANSNQVNYAGGNVCINLDLEFSNKIRSKAKNLGVSLNTFMLAIYALLLSKYTDQKDVTFGVPFFNRHYPSVGGMLGFFVNALPVRIILNKDWTMRQLILNVNSEITRLMRFQDTPLSNILEYLGNGKLRTQNNLYTSVFQVDYLDASLNEEYSLYRDFSFSRYPLEFCAEDIKNEGINIYISYQTARYRHDTVANIANTFKCLLNWFVANDENLLAVNAQMVNSQDYNKIVNLWNQTAQATPIYKTVLELFEEQAAKTPDNIALVYEDLTLSYADLNARSNQLAHYLSTQAQSQPETLIALCLDKSEQMIIAILGVLKAGCAYVPIDPTYPDSRISYIVGDTHSKLILTNEKHATRLKQIFSTFSGNNNLVFPLLLAIDSQEVELKFQNQASSNLNLPINSQHLAYVIYTSGTTGLPKGVMVEHGGVVNLAVAQAAAFGLQQVLKSDSSQRNCLLYANYVFDAHVSELFTVICHGHILHVLNESTRKNLSSLERYIQLNAINLATIPPALLSVDHLFKLDTLVVAGEVTPIEVMQYYQQQNVQLINAYGPTEATVCATWHRYKISDSNTNIGRPMLNVQTYILDADLQIVPVGAIGELYIGGAGVARGYLNQPELTATKFIKNPFQTPSEKQANINANLYKTGDLGYYLADGSIEYVGRGDTQVKIRGFRIELNEIQAALMSYPDINHAVVIAKGNMADRHLVAYYVQNLNLADHDDAELVKNWQELYNLNYQRLDQTNFKQNIHGWDSSYTNLPIAELDMQEWVEDGVTRISGLKPKVVVEIGCGSGLILFNLFEVCKRYYAFDFSDNSIAYINQVVQHYGFADKIKAMTALADNIPYATLINEHYDTVIINSVIQYFPNQEYLEQVINAAINNMSSSGQIFIGDVRDYRLLECFHYSILNYQAIPTTRGLIHEKVQRENELLVSPGYFVDLKLRQDKISHLEILPKLSIADHEMNNYRYDVILHINQPDNKAIPLKNQRLILTSADLLSCLGGGIDSYLYIKYPNQRIANDYLACQKLMYGETLNLFPEPILSISAITQLVKSHGYSVKFMLNINDPLYYDIVIYPESAKNDRFVNYDTLNADIEPVSFTNNPLVTVKILSQNNEQALATYLATKLPEYMIPSRFVRLAKLPLTLNGKLDVRALPDVEVSYTKDGHQAPKSYLEIKVCNLIAETLSLPANSVGLMDDFFSLGGNSILAIKLVSKLASQLGIQLSIAEVFKHRVVNNLLTSVLSEYQAAVIIPKRNTEDPNRLSAIPLSFAQQRLWFIEQYEEGSNAYNIPLIQKLAATINLAALEAAVQATVARHEVLHSLIQVDSDGNPGQVVVDVANQPLLIAKIPYTTAAELTELIKLKVNQVFNLASEYPIQVTLLEDQVSFEVHLLIVVHHIAFDGWSIELFLADLSAYYAYFLELDLGTNPVPINLPELGIQYGDFAVWQRNYFNDDRLASQLMYWKSKLHGYESLSLPIDKPRPIKLSHAGENIYFELNSASSIKLRSIAKELGVSLYSVLLSGFNLLLSCYTNQDDIVIGVPIANRHTPQLEHLVGFFVNTLVLRSRINPQQRLVEYIQQTGNEVIEAQLHQDLPFEKLVEALNEARDSSKNPIFQVMFSMQHFGTKIDGGNIGNSASNPFSPDLVLNLNTIYTAAQFDLSVFVDDGQQELKICLNYALSLFNRLTIQQIGSTYEYILKQLADLNSNSNCQIKELCYLNPDAYTRVITNWNQEQKAYPGDKTIHQLFEEQVAQYPDNIALVYGAIKLSYAELNQKANQLAHYLRAKYSIKGDQLCALCLDRSEQMLIAVLGVLKSGAAYVPLDPSYPDERIAYILADTQATVLLSNEYNVERLSRLVVLAEVNCPVLAIDAVSHGLLMAEQSVANPALTVTSRNLAYVIYTSGTTGKPKGVMIEHRSVNNTILHMQDIYGGQSAQVVRALEFSNYVFDVSLSEIFTPLYLGYELHLVSSDIQQNTALLEDYILNYSINIVYLPPIILALLDSAKDYPQLQVIIYAGEPCAKAVALNWSNRVKLYNLYGPTEASIYALGLQIEKNEVELIGRPIANVTAYVLDAGQKLLPAGALGELYIGGSGLARGYLNQPELTAAKFIANPFQSAIEAQNNLNSRLYQTGDLVRYLADGSLEYIGRKDLQVKIRGFRIELGEIESCLNTYPQVKQSAVLVFEHKNSSGVSNGNKYLVAYYVADSQLDEGALRSHLERSLPEYMLPKCVIYLEQLPLNINGKLNRKALPVPEISAYQDAYLAPATEMEHQVCLIFAAVLNLAVDKIGVNDSFFKLGGNSILAIKLIGKLNQHFQSDLKVSTIIRQPNIAELVKVIPLKDNYQTLIKLNMAEGKPTMFMFHPGQSGCEVYAQLAEQLKEQYVCYGIDNYNLHHDVKYLSLNALANYYLSALFERDLLNQSDQEVVLLGWSLGGLIALELAAILELRGYTQLKVYLLDSIIFDSELRNLQNLITNQAAQLESYLLSQSYAADYVQKIVANLASETSLQHSTISRKLIHTKLVLFKAMQKSPQYTGEVADLLFKHILQLTTNNFESIVGDGMQIQVFELANSHHWNILEQAELVSRLKG